MHTGTTGAPSQRKRHTLTRLICGTFLVTETQHGVKERRRAAPQHSAAGLFLFLAPELRGGTTQPLKCKAVALEKQSPWENLTPWSKDVPGYMACDSERARDEDP